MAVDTVYINGWIQLKVTFLAFAQYFQCTLNFRNDGPSPTTSQLNALALAFYNQIVTPWMNCLSTQVQMISVVATDRSFAGANQGIYSPSSTYGAVGSDALPLGSCIVVSERSTGIGRRKRGRFYISGITELDAVSNGISAGLQVKLLLLMQALGNFLGTATLPGQLVVASRASGALYTILTYVLDTYLDSQRRRLTGRGT